MPKYTPTRNRRNGAVRPRSPIASDRLKVHMNPPITESHFRRAESWANPAGLSTAAAADGCSRPAVAANAPHLMLREGLARPDEAPPALSAGRGKRGAGGWMPSAARFRAGAVRRGLPCAAPLDGRPAGAPERSPRAPTG